MIATYDPKLFTFSHGEHLTAGYATGSFFKFAASEVGWTVISGADGMTCRVKSNNLTAKFTVTLLQTSPSNDYFSSVWNLDRASNTGVKAAMAKDGSGRTVISAQNTWVSKMVEVEFGTDHTAREWELETDAYATPTIGGN